MPQLVTEEKEEEKGEGAMRGEGAADEAAPGEGTSANAER